jgi:hypothetical protein
LNFLWILQVNSSTQKFKKKSLKKMLGPDLADLGHFDAGRPNLRGHMGGKVSRRADRPDALLAAGRAEGVRGKEDCLIKLRSMAPSHLQPPAGMDRAEP